MLKVDAPHLERTLRPSAFTLSSNKILCQQASFLRRCNQFFIMSSAKISVYASGTPKPFRYPNLGLPLKPLLVLRQDTGFDSSDDLVKGRILRPTRKPHPRRNHNRRLGGLFESLGCSAVGYFRITIFLVSR